MMVRKKSISATKFGAYLIYAIIMICVGIVTIILNKYDGVCGILCGVTMLHVSYNDRNTYSRFTIPYIDNLQAFEGNVIAKRNRGLNSSFTVRKISSGEGVERVFQTNSPLIASVKVTRRGDVRRAKLYYLRDRAGKSARIREKIN